MNRHPCASVFLASPKLQRQCIEKAVRRRIINGEESKECWMSDRPRRACRPASILEGPVLDLEMAIRPEASLAIALRRLMHRNKTTSQFRLPHRRERSAMPGTSRPSNVQTSRRRSAVCSIDLGDETLARLLGSLIAGIWLAQRKLDLDWPHVPIGNLIQQMPDAS